MWETRHEGDPEAASRMAIKPALKVLADLRREDQIVVTHMGSAREWPRLGRHPFDFHFVPSTMGGAIPLGLGLALAQPRREVLVCSGDGALLMNLGCLITVVASRAANLSIVVIDNGVYEVTGGQKTPSRLAETDFAGLARGAGFPNVAHFWNLTDLQQRLPDILRARGPRFIWLEIEPLRDDYQLDPPVPMREQVAQLRAALRKSP